jgi:ADP-ribose pyrophosphatase YjhB (NUDIX family)
MATNPGVDYLYSVGDRVHHMETAEEAVKREVLEETGVAMEPLRLAAVHENFFRGAMDDPNLLCHEIALYFLMKPASLDAIKDVGISMDGMPEHLVWVPFEDFGESNICPGFLPQALKNDGVLHLVTREKY